MLSFVCTRTEASQTPDEDAKPYAEMTFLVAGVEVTGENQDDIFGDGKAVYSPDKKTLTFNDLKMDGKVPFII